MKNILLAITLIFSFSFINAQQKVIQLYNGAAPGSESWIWDEKFQDSSKNMFRTNVVYDVSKPTLTVFQPDSSIANGTAAIICPGGGFHLLSINSEGIDVANWLMKKGVTCFVLKYRVMHSVTGNPVQDMMDMVNKKQDSDDETKTIIAMAISDGHEAMAYVRKHATEYKINPGKIGIIGFSAGGTVAASAALNYTKDNKPDFVAPIYAFMPDSVVKNIPADAPPMFLAAASDDQLGLVPHSINLYNKWIDSKHQAELHLYVKGGHGFGMRVQNIPTDSWIERLGEWLQLMGYIKPGSMLSAQQVGNMQKTLKDWCNINKYAADNEAIKSIADKNGVVFMGNSITEGWKNADADFFSQNPYIDRGISGQTTPQMLVRFREDVIDLKPAVVVILAGINDIAQNTGYIKLEDTYGNIISMAELAKANNIKVVLSSVLPAYDFPWRPGMQPAEKVVKLNEMLKAYASKHNIVYVDYFSAMADERKGLPTNLSGDGVHPNLAGYKIMEPLVQRAIADAMKK